MPNKMIYLTQQNADNLSSEENMSGLVNRLLVNYYAGRTIVSPTRIAASDDKSKKFEELKTKYPPLEIRTELPLEQGKLPPLNIPDIMSREQTIAPPEYGA
jgi:hypothetical protein